MTEKINLTEYKRQIYLLYSEDGLADLAVGLMIFGFGFLLLVDLPALVGLMGLIPFLVWYFGKQTLVIPRVGSIQPGQEIKKRFTGFFVNLCLLGIGVLVFYFLNQRSGNDFLSSYSFTIFGFVLALGISSLGVMLKSNRFYFHAVLVFLAIAVGEFLGTSITAVDPFLVSVISAGSIIMIAGLVVLVKFMNKYPVVRSDD
jgi:hypothetical protein